MIVAKKYKWALVSELARYKFVDGYLVDGLGNKVADLAPRATGPRALLRPTEWDRQLIDVLNWVGGLVELPGQKS